MILEGVRAIGEAVLERTPLVEALVDTRLLEQEVQKGKDRGLIVTLDVRLDPPRLNLEMHELDEQILVEVLWVGNASGSNSPQDRLTTDHVKYLASQTVPNLLKPEALREGGELRAKLETLREAVYLDLGEKADVFPDGGGDQQYERYRWVWDLRKLGVDGEALERLAKRDREEVGALCGEEDVECLTPEFLQAYARKKGKAAETVKLVGKVLKDWVARRLDVKGSQIKLYTLALEGEPLAGHPDYRTYIERKLVDEVFEGPEAEEGTCYLCGARGRVTANTTRFKLLKFYITDKLGFASGLHKRGFLRNYVLCKGCYTALLAGERFVENAMRTRLGWANVYVIPTFHAPDVHFDAKTLEGWAKYFKDRLAASESLKKWHEFQQELEAYRFYEQLKALFVLNLLFATKGQAAVKVEKLIPEVPPSRLDRLDDVRNRVYDQAAELLGESLDWDLSLGKLFYLLPLRQRDTKPYLEFLDALLMGRPLNVHELIPQLLETACIHRFERYEAHVHGRPQDPEREMVLHLVRSQLFLLYLRELGQLRGWGGETTMETPKGDAVAEVERDTVGEDLRAWMDGLVGVQRGLFLLGVLLGRIGSTREQRDSGKPILNKVHFQGMDRHKLMRLANEVYEKLRQYKIADYNEGLYAAMKAHFDRALEGLSSPQENVYWVLSGYAYSTWQAIRAGRAKAQRTEAEQEFEKRGSF